MKSETLNVKRFSHCLNLEYWKLVFGVLCLVFSSLEP